MILKAAITLKGKYEVKLDLSVDLFFDEPWSTLGKGVTFYINDGESMKML